MLSVEIFLVGRGALIDNEGQEALQVVKRELKSVGYLPIRITLLPPDLSMAIREVRRAKEESRLILILAEMGIEPTDPGRQLAAYFSDSPFILDRTVAKELSGRFHALKEPELFALRPEKSRFLEQWITPCSALFFEEEGVHFFFLPYQSKAAVEELMKSALLPHLKERFLYEGIKMKSPTLWDLSQKESDELEAEIKERFPLLTVNISRIGKKTQFLLTSPDGLVEELEEMELFLSRRFEGRFLGERELAEAVHDRLLSLKKKLMVAESCTGGALAAALVANPDASSYFQGGIVCYSNTLKEQLLSVKTLDSFGAVSKETAEAMVDGLFQHFSIDIALAITGIAGPTGGSFDKPVGTVWISLGINKKDKLTKSFHFRGNRLSIIEQAKEAALELLLCYNFPK